MTLHNEKLISVYKKYKCKGLGLFHMAALTQA
jgi:hypothetical protein